MARAVGKVLPAVLRITRWLMAGVTVYHTPWLMLTPQLSVASPSSVAWVMSSVLVLTVVRSMAPVQTSLGRRVGEGGADHQVPLLPQPPPARMW